eukprot:1014568_1
MSLEDVTDLMNQFHNNTHVDTSSPTMRAQSDSKPGLSANFRILCTPEPIRIPRLVETVPVDLKGRAMREPGTPRKRRDKVATPRPLLKKRKLEPDMP